MNSPCAWVTGAGGLIGSYVARIADQVAPGWRVRGLTRPELDLTNFSAVEQAFTKDRPQLVIHCAALTRNPACTADPALARRLNVEVTRHLADLASDARLLLLSTDLVFDGRQGHYDESSAPNPQSIYAETKVEAERAVRRHPGHSVIRTSLNGGTSPTGDRGFNEELRRAWSAGRRLTLFTDEFRAPLFAGATARAVWELALAAQPGLYHVAGSERLSRFEIGKLVAARWPDLKPVIAACSLSAYAGPPRPPDTTLDCAKAQALLSFPLPGLSSWLADNLREVF